MWSVKAQLTSQGSLPRSCTSMFAFSRSRAAVGQRLLRLGQQPAQRLEVCRSIWHHRNPWDMDELGRKNLADSTPLQSIDEVEHQRKRDERGHEEAKEAAAKLLAVRPHSQKELRTKLLEKGFGMELIKDAIDRLHELGLQSDAEFAEVFARSKWRTSKWGPAKLEAELARRGVARQHVQAALQRVFGEQGLRIGIHIEDLSAGGPAHAAHSGTGAAAVLGGWTAGGGAGGAGADPARALLAEARKQFSLSRSLAMDGRKRRLVGWLQRRGHRWEDISRILKQLEREAAAEALDSSEAEGEEELASPRGGVRSGRSS